MTAAAPIIETEKEEPDRQNLWVLLGCAGDGEFAVQLYRLIGCDDLDSRLSECLVRHPAVVFVPSRTSWPMIAISWLATRVKLIRRTVAAAIPTRIALPCCAVGNPFAVSPHCDCLVSGRDNVDRDYPRKSRERFD